MQASKFIFIGLLIAGQLCASDLLLLSAEHIIGAPADLNTWSFSSGRESIERYDGGQSPTIQAVMANTNSAEFAAWVAGRNADAVDTAALGQEMTAALFTAINAEWGIVFNGSKKQTRQLSRRLITESKTARQTLEDKDATVPDRLGAIAKLRRLDVISGYATSLGIGGNL